MLLMAKVMLGAQVEAGLQARCRAAAGRLNVSMSVVVRAALVKWLDEDAADRRGQERADALSEGTHEG
jgi:Arc/MetJ-type ribon-helix-helix transcriptional regulator